MRQPEPPFEKQEETLPDGRRIVYFAFPEAPAPQPPAPEEEAVQPPPPEEG